LPREDPKHDWATGNTAIDFTNRSEKTQSRIPLSAWYIRAFDYVSSSWTDDFAFEDAELEDGDGPEEKPEPDSSCRCSSWLSNLHEVQNWLD